MIKGNTLFLGNGFTISTFKKSVSWKDLLEAEDDKSPYTLLYEMMYLMSPLLLEKGSNTEYIRKCVIAEKLCLSVNDIKSTVKRDIKKLGHWLKNQNIGNIITTNYDKGIELILTCKCGYKLRHTKQENTFREDIYSIRTYKVLRNDGLGHEVRIWEIHGSIDRIKSILLGYDQYCGALAKMKSYFNGEYTSKKGVSCSISMKRKCEINKYRYIFNTKMMSTDYSWIDLFFSTTMYIAGFGLSYDEMDIWWLLNKRARIHKENKKLIRNKIYYLYSERDNERISKISKALTLFQVKMKKIGDEHFLYNVFNTIGRTTHMDD